LKKFSRVIFVVILTIYFLIGTNRPAVAQASVSVAFAAISGSGSESVTSVNIPINLSVASTQTVSVIYHTTGGTASGVADKSVFDPNVTYGTGKDYEPLLGTLIFSPGETSKNITLNIINDTINEIDETVEITLSNPGSAVLGTNTKYTYTINDNDNKAIIDVTKSPYNVDKTGATDTTKAINQAATDANAKGGAVVYFPAGTYILDNNGSSSVQNLFPNVTYQGDGIGKTIIKRKPAQIASTSITAITATNPAQITTANSITYNATTNPNGLATDSRIYFNGITQANWLGLNNQSFVVTMIDDHNFTINFDASSFTTSYSSSNPTIMYKQKRWERTFYGTASGANDSAPIIIKDMTIDGDSQDQGPYTNFVLEHAAQIFVSGDVNQAGHMKVYIENVHFQNTVADALEMSNHVDVNVYNVSAENIYRCGLGTGGDGLILNAKNFSAGQNMYHGAVHFEDTQKINANLENINLDTGSFDISVGAGSVVNGNNIIANGGSSFSLGTAMGHFSHSQFRRTHSGGTNTILYSQNVTFDDCIFLATRDGYTGSDLTLVAAPTISWTTQYGDTTNGVITFNNCGFDFDSDPNNSKQSGDTAYGLMSTADDKTKNNQIIINGGYVTNKLDYGFNLGLGGNLTVKNTFIEASNTAIKWQGVNGTYANVTLDGIVSTSPRYMYYTGDNVLNTLTQNNIMLDELNSQITSYYSNGGLNNAYVGNRFILGTNNPPLASTNCFLNDTYSLKNPTSGQTNEWLCTKKGYWDSNDSKIAGTLHNATWTSQTISPVVATLVTSITYPNYNTSASFTVGGIGMTNYVYKLDGGTYGPEFAVGTPIKLDNLSLGSHTLSVKAKKIPNFWQDDNLPTTYTWLISKKIGIPTVSIPNISFVKAVDKTKVNKGEILTYILTFNNDGTGDATNVVISDVIPSGTTYVSGSINNNGQFNSVNNTVNWNLGTLSIGSIGNMQFQVKIN